MTEETRVGRPERVRKIDTMKLAQLLREGKTQRFCADYFHVSHSSIKEAIAKMKRDLVAVPSKDDAHSGSIDAMHQLQQINTAIIAELQRCNKLIVREESRMNRVDQLSTELEVEPDNKEKQEELSRLIATNTKVILAIQTNLIGISGEVRRQVELQLKIAETLYNVQMMQEFQNEIIGILKDTDPISAQRLITKLKERRAIRGLVRMNA